MVAIRIYYPQFMRQKSAMNLGRLNLHIKAIRDIYTVYGYRIRAISSIMVAILTILHQLPTNQNEKSRTRRQSQRLCLSRPVLTHVPRQAHAWLIFDVGQNKMEIRAPKWQLAKEKCPCCDQNGELIFSSCPACDDMVLICSEVGSIFGIKAKEIAEDIIQPTCRKCGTQKYEDFRDATSQEIQSLGFQVRDYR